MGFHPFWIGGMGLFGFAVVIAIVLLVVVLTRGTTSAHPVPPYPPAPPRETPLDILARRFAAGEITAEDYEKGRDLLSGGGKTP